MSDQQVTVLRADVSGGRPAASIIEEALGSPAIESGDEPGVRKPFHTDFTHIQQATEDPMGDHFVFHMHLDEDLDPTCADRTDRQRCEIKGTKPEVVALADETLTLAWSFKIDGEMAVSKKFTHLFQLKSVGGDHKHPIVTLTGYLHGDEERFEVRWSPSSEKDDPKRDTPLADTVWDGLRDQWLDVSCRAKCGADGSFSLKLSRHVGGEVLIDFVEEHLNMWRGGEFVRPKWGIYRSLEDRGRLRDCEEIVRFANFRIEKTASDR